MDHVTTDPAHLAEPTPGSDSSDSADLARDTAPDAVRDSLGLAPTSGRLQEGLPRWFGPGNEPPALIDSLDAPQLGVFYQDVEALISWLRYAQAAAAQRIVDEALALVGHEPVELHGQGSRVDEREYAMVMVGDELKCLTGMAPHEAETRVSFATAPAEATAHLAEGMRAGTCSWEKARYVYDKVASLDPIAADDVAHKALAPARRGEVTSWRTFTDRVRRAVDAVSSTTKRRKEAKDGREAYAMLDEHGMARFVITGESPRVIAAFERVDEQARRMRADGDPRTLKQLRSDVALDLILNGELAQFTGALPAGRVAVSVSLASLMNLTDAPGHTRFGDLPAAIVRQVAMTEGTTISRLVTDPVNGSVFDATTDSYRPTARMRRFITARDRTCRAPGCSHAAERCDLDHGVNWPEGPTSPTNLTAKHRPHHEFKTRRWWKAVQHPDDTVSWRTLCGEYTTYPARYDTDLIDEAHTIIARRMTEIEAAREARLATYRAHIDTCGQRTHDDCRGSDAWRSTIDPGLDCGRAPEPEYRMRDHFYPGLRKPRPPHRNGPESSCPDRCENCETCLAATEPHPLPPDYLDTDNLDDYADTDDPDHLDGPEFGDDPNPSDPADRANPSEAHVGLTPAEKNDLGIYRQHRREPALKAPRTVRALRIEDPGPPPF